MTEEVQTLTCANHPGVATNLRCNRCEKPICSRCAVLTPTGYRCRECVKNQSKVFDTSRWFDYPLAFLVAAVLAYIGSLIVPRLGFFTIFLAPVAGVIIAEAIRAMLRKRRSLNLFKTAAAGAIIGCLPAVLPMLFGLLSGLGVLLPLVWQLLYAFTVTSTVYYRLSGIQMRA